MAVEATPLTESTELFTVPEIRRFLRDYTSRNILLDDVEFSDDDIEAAKRWTLMSFNALPPPIMWETVESVPPAAHIILLIGVCRHLMLSESMRQMRNQLTVQDGDVAPIGLDDKHNMYLQTAQLLEAMFKEQAQQFKIAFNMDSAYGYLASGYAGVGRIRST